MCGLVFSIIYIYIFHSIFFSIFKYCQTTQGVTKEDADRAKSKLKIQIANIRAKREIAKEAMEHGAMPKKKAKKLPAVPTYEQWRDPTSSSSSSSSGYGNGGPRSDNTVFRSFYEVV